MANGLNFLLSTVPCSIRGSEQFQTSSNEAYDVVRGTGRTAEGEYEVIRDLPPSTSSQPTTAAAGDSLYESV